MRILIVGATGFIGNAIFHSLISEHDIIIGSRKPLEGYDKWRHIDFSKENKWDEIVNDIELVINAVGIIEGDFEQIQTKTPLQLFDSCIKKDIRIINISAIGAEKENISIPFLASKKKTDDFLLTYKRSRIIYPGIVIGKGSKSTQFFTEIAQWPIIPLMADKTPPLIHISQLTDLVKKVINDFDNYPQKIFAVAKPESLTNLLTAIRGKNGKFIKVPMIIFNMFFMIFPKAKIGIFNKNMLHLLGSISAYDYQAVCSEASRRIDSRELIKSSFIVEYISILAISFIWIWSGLSSLYSWELSNELMNEIGAKDYLATVLIWAGSIIDIVLGSAVFFKRIRKPILLIQICFVIIYTIILSIFAPIYWIHPFGVLSKNIPLIALTLYLFQKNKNE